MFISKDDLDCYQAKTRAIGALYADCRKKGLSMPKTARAIMVRLSTQFRMADRLRKKLPNTYISL